MMHPGIRESLHHPSVRLRGEEVRGEGGVRGVHELRARCTYSPHLYSNSNRPIRVAAARKYRQARAAPLALTPPPPRPRSVVWRVLYRRGYRKYRERPESRQLFYGPAGAYPSGPSTITLSLFRDRRDRGSTASDISAIDPGHFSF
jgi:hypothetical protein